MISLFHTKTWIILLFAILAITKSQERKHLKKFYRFNSSKSTISKFYPNRVKLLPLSSSVLFGQKRYLKKETKESLKKIGIYHLLTPSGLHLQIILSLFSAFLFYTGFEFRQKMVILFCPLFHLDKYYAIKRVLLLKILRLVPHCKSIKLRFTLVILYDILSGNFTDSWMSSLFSFTALSIILFTKSPLKRLIEFFLFQVIINLYFETKIYLLSLFISPLLTGMSIIFLPILILNFFVIQSERIDQSLIQFLTSFDRDFIVLERLTPFLLVVILIRYLFEINILKSKRILTVFIFLYSS